MAFTIIEISFLVTLSMNKYTNIVIPPYFQFIQIPIVKTELGIICILIIYVMKYCHGWLRWDENNLGSDNNYDTINPRSPKKCYKEWKTMLGDTTPGFTMSIEQLVTLNTTFSYHSNRQHLVLISNIRGGGYDHLTSTRISILILNDIFIWAP